MPDEREESVIQPAVGGMSFFQSQQRESGFQAIEARQGHYLAAGGTLIQFNAVMAAILLSAFTSSENLLKALIAGALLLHVLAAFLLCWSARPVDETVDLRQRAKLNLEEAVASAQQAANLNARRATDTFRNYRRGWRATLLAITMSTGAVMLFLLQSFDAKGLLDRIISSVP